MKTSLIQDRRSFLGIAGSAAALAPGGLALAAGAAGLVVGGEGDQPLLLLGIACSPRAGRTTAMAVRAALESAAKVNPRIRTELIEMFP